MSLIDLSDHSRIWIYQSNRALNATEEKAAESMLQDFTANWKAHEIPLKAGYEIAYHQVIILAVDETQAGASGCSIDSSVHIIQSLESTFQISLFVRLEVALIQDGALTLMNRAQILDAWTQGRVNEDSLMLDHTVQNLGEWRNSWIKPLKYSWAARWVPMQTT